MSQNMNSIMSIGGIAMTENEPTITTDTIMVHAFPYGHELFHRFSMKIIRRPNNRWVVNDYLGQFYGPDHTFSYKIDYAIERYDPETGETLETTGDTPYDSQDWYDIFWMDYDTALEVAKRYVQNTALELDKRYAQKFQGKPRAV